MNAIGKDMTMQQDETSIAELALEIVKSIQSSPADMRIKVAALKSAAEVYTQAVTLAQAAVVFDSYLNRK